MKNFTLLFILTILTSFTVLKGQTKDLPQQHRIGAGPILGYDHKLKAPAYGVGLMYEYKPFKMFGFTASLNYEQTRKNLGSTDFSNTGDGILKHHMYSASLGERYYFNSFYLGGALGVAQERGQTKMDDGTIYKGGSTNSLYRSLGIGYQLPMRNGDLLEMEVGTFGTKNSMKWGGTVRYKFLK